MDRKTSTIIGVIILTLLLVGAFFMYQYFVNSFTSIDKIDLNPYNGDSNTRTTNWKTYTNDQNGLKFQYPEKYFSDVKINSGTTNTLDLGKNADIFLEANSAIQNDELRFTVIGSKNDLNTYKESLNERGQEVTDLETWSIDGQKSYSFKTGALNQGYYYETFTHVIPYSKNSTFLYFSITHGGPYDPKRQEYLTENESKLLGEIVDTLKFTGANLVPQEAINFVKNLPEVKSWLALFNQSSGTSGNGGKPIIEIDHQNSTTYFIHAYELTNDHTATHNWYDVDIKTGNIKTEF